MALVDEIERDVVACEAALAAGENDTFHPNVLPMMLDMICKPGYPGTRTVVFPPGTYDTFAAGLPPASG